MEKNELKIQGVVEAAQDPESRVSAEDVKKKIVEESKKAGVASLTFDPNATTAEKRAQAKAAIPEGFGSLKPKGVSIVTDVDDDGAPLADLPPPSKAGVIEPPKDKDGKPLLDGEDPEEAEPPFSRTAWAPQFGWPNESIHDSESLLDHQTWLEGRLPDKFYGDWYHNAAVIVFACLASWLIAVLGGGLAWVFIVMAACGTYYRTSIRRVRRNFRDDINREMSLKRLETDSESLEWINSFLVKFWPIYAPVIAETVINSVDQVLSGATPPFLDSLKLAHFTLGSKPPRMEHVKTYPRAEDDIVIMDWKFSFTPNDTADMTSRQLKNKINPKVVLEIRIGKAMISKGLDVIVENMTFEGLMRVKVKLQIPFPHVEKVEICFLERPTIDYVCKPLGGETFGFDINFIPGLESFILEQIHGTLAPMMYSPNVFPIEVAKMLAGTPVDQAIGVIAITLHGAQGLKNPDNFSGLPDPYAVVTINRRQELARTKHIKDNPNPRWNETHFIIVTSFNDSLDIQIFDYNDFRKHKELGVASFALENVEDLNVYENERIEVVADGKARGLLMADIRFFPVLEGKKVGDKLEPPPESNTGILRFTVEQAKDLDGSKSLVGMLNPYAILHLNGKDVHQTKKLKRTNNPIWDNGAKEMLITDRKNAKLGVTIKDDREIAGDQTLGKYQIKLDDMLDCMAKGQEWYNLSGAQTGRVKMMAQWKPVAIQGQLGGTGGYITPIGVMRLHFRAAKELRNFEAMGKSDPYVRVLLSGIEKARTVTFQNDLNPKWDEVLYIPVHSARERLTLEVMDSEKLGKDRSLGLIELEAGDYMAQDETGEWLVHDQKVEREEGLRIHGKGVAKGLLQFTAAFYPCLNVADPDEEEEEKPQAEAKPASESNEEGEKPPATPVTPKTPVTPATTATSPRKSREEPRGPPKIRLSPQELLKYESGLVIFKLMEAEMPKGDTHLEVFVDDMAFPSYISSKAKKRGHEFDEIGDCFIRELDFSRLTLKIREKTDKQDENKDKTLARLTGNTLDTLKQCLNNPTTLVLKDDEGRPSTVKVSLKYIPVKMELDPSESINNMGNLRVDVLDAKDLPAADSNGKSDPYAKFELNGQEVYKTKVQKKTLHPAWNEFFEVPIPSRTAANFFVKVNDYDFADKPDHLGTGVIDLKNLVPFKPSEVNLPLDGKSGSVRLRMLFRPAYVTRMRQGTSTFSGTFATPGRIVTGVAGAPVKGVVAVGGVVGHGVGKGASFLKRGFKSKKDDEPNGLTPASTFEVPTITTNGGSSDFAAPGMGLKRATGFGAPLAEPDSPNASPPGPAANGSSNGGLLSHARTKSVSGASIHSTLPGGAMAGTATFTVVSAAGYPPSADVYVAVQQLTPKNKTVGKTKHHKASNGAVFKFDETFTFKCTPDAQFQLKAFENHTFSSDNDLGEALYFVDESGTNAEKEVKVGQGTVTIRSNFTPAAESLLPDSPKSVGLRRSFLSKRESRSREGTPNP